MNCQTVIPDLSIQIKSNEIQHLGSKMANVLVAVLYGKVAKVLGFSRLSLRKWNFFTQRSILYPACSLMYQSIPSTNIPPSLGKPPGNFSEVVKSAAPGQKFSCKSTTPGAKNTYPRGVF